MSASDDIDLQYKPGSTKYDFDEDDFQTFLQYKQRWNPGFEFDPDWIAHLRRTNGGVPLRNAFDTPPPDVESRGLDYMYYFKRLGPTSDNASVGRIHTLAGDSGAFHYNCIPFGQLFNGDLLCFDHRENLAGPAPVVIWLHEESQEDDPVFQYVAPTFRDFVQMLYKDEEDES